MQKDISIDKAAVTRAVRAPLEAYYKDVAATGYDGTSMRPGNWEEDESLFKALVKSKYVSQHLDWLYVVELIYSVLDHNPELTPAAFAEKLEKLIVATASHRDYLAVFPLSFRPSISYYLPGRPRSLTRRRSIGRFVISPPTPTSKALSRITVSHGFPEIGESDFQHAMRTSNKAFTRDMVVTFAVHGAQDQLRWTAEIAFTHFRRLIEVFDALFGGEPAGFGSAMSVNHFFLLNKTNGELRRFPTRAPSVADLTLSASLLQAIGRPAFKEFLSKVSSSNESMYGRLRNAIKFYSMALNADDNVSSFLFHVISMESIFSRDKNNPIKVTLADLGAMLCFPPAQRRDAHQKIRDAYDLRSAIVHNGASVVTRDQVRIAKLLAARAIYASLFLSDRLEKAGSGKLEDRFFSFLRDQKLGLEKAAEPRELWALPEIVDSEDA
jgi:hypothetical protein